MINKKSISVVVPFKNNLAIPQVEECINSLFKQTILAQEIIIVGHQNKPSLLDKLLRLKSVVFIDFIGDKNEARNTGIMAARGDYVVYLDHDMRADSRLLEACLEASNQYEAVIIPEKGVGGGFWENCKKLEKELIAYDVHTVTPRFYRRELFNKDEKPFDSNFGLLDEWGFNHKLMKKKISVGYCQSFVMVKENNFSLKEEVLNKFKRGLWMRNFSNVDKDEAWTRINPLKRGIIFYSQKINYFFKSPIYFSGVIILKAIDFVSFMTGYLVSYLFTAEKKQDNSRDISKFYDALAGNYLSSMYTDNNWTGLVDKREKEIVKSVWNIQSQKTISDEILLDLGMGPGRWSRFFLDQGFGRVYGVDIAPGMVNYAKQTICDRNFKAVISNMQKLPFSQNEFDRVFCFRAFKYLDNPDAAVEEINRVMKRKGTFFLEVSNKSFLNISLKLISKILVNFGRDLLLESKWRYFNKTNFYSQKDIQKMMSRHNLKIISCQPIFVLPSIPIPAVNQKISQAWNFFDLILMKSLPKRWFARSWVFVISKDE